MVKLLVVDDEPDVVGIISLAFQYNRPEYNITEAYDGVEALEKLAQSQYDLVIMDVAMPRMDGFAVTKAIRKTSTVPIILLTAAGLEADKVRGLELGADDYITKPFGHKELIARVEAVLRRASAQVSSSAPSELIRYGDLEMDFSQHRVLLRGKPVELTPTEYRLLYQLANNRGRVLLQDTLLAKVWGASYRNEAYYLKVYIHRLREKLGDDPSDPQYIQTVRGVGYTFGKEANE